MAESAPGHIQALARRMVSGVAATLSTYLATRLINLLVTVALARLLAPEGMGVIAAAILTVELIDAWRDFGLREAVVYEPGREPVVPATAFALIMLVACAQAIALAAAAPAVAAAFGNADIAALLTWLALLFPVNGLGAVQEAMLQKKLRFLPRGIADVVGAAVKLAVTLGLLSAGHGVWSAVWGVLAAAATRTAMLTVLSRWRPSVRPTMEAARRLLRFGRHIALLNVLAPLRLKIDQFAIVTLMGDTALGLYFIASRIPELVIFGVNGIITRVVFPSFVTIAGDSRFLARAYLTTTKWCLVLMAPIAVGLAATAGQSIPLLFGSAWRDAIPVLVWLSLAGLPLTVGWNAGDVFKSTGRPYLLTLAYGADIAVGAPLVWLAAGLTGDLAAVALAVLAAETVSAGVRLHLMRRFAGVSVAETLRVLVAPIAAAAVMGATVVLFSRHFEAIGGWPLLGSSVLVGVVTYAVALAAFDRRAVADGLQLVARH